MHPIGGTLLLLKVARAIRIGLWDTYRSKRGFRSLSVPMEVGYAIWLLVVDITSLNPEHRVQELEYHLRVKR